MYRMKKPDRILKTASESGVINSEFTTHLGISKQNFSQVKIMKQDIIDKYLVTIVEKLPDTDAQLLTTERHGKEDYEIDYRRKQELLEKQFNEKADLLQKSYKALIEAKDATIQDKDHIISLKDEIIKILNNGI